MKRDTPNAPRADLEPRLRKIQSTWSPSQRRRRADAGHRRMQELYRLIEEADEGEIWAVGAPAWDDLRRLAS